MVSFGFPGRTSPVVGTALSISKPKRCLAFRSRASCGTAGFGVTLHHSSHSPHVRKGPSEAEVSDQRPRQRLPEGHLSLEGS